MPGRWLVQRENFWKWRWGVVGDLQQASSSELRQSIGRRRWCTCALWDPYQLWISCISVEQCISWFELRGVQERSAESRCCGIKVRRFLAETLAERPISLFPLKTRPISISEVVYRHFCASCGRKLSREPPTERRGVISTGWPRPQAWSDPWSTSERKQYEASSNSYYLQVS